MAVKHFSHEHPLILKENKNGKEEKERVCNCCGFVMRGSAYSCAVNCSFYLHIICADLPEELEDHPSHPEHTLTLFDCNSSSSFNCSICRKHFSTGFGYRCSSCDRFNIDIICASSSILIHHSGHEQHPLQPWLVPASFLCSGCGNRHEEGISFLCNRCPFWIHECCFSLPHVIEHDSHIHPLSITLYVRCHPNLVFLCSVCREEISGGTYWFYRCDQCNYLIHVKCLTKSREERVEIKEEEHLDEVNLVRLPVSDVRSVGNIITQFIKGMCQLECNYQGRELADGVDHDRELNHFSHEHPLILCKGERKESCSESLNSRLPISSNANKQRENVQVCEACVLPILAPPYYICSSSSCDFHLHLWCAKLPRALRRPFHAGGHRLVLLGKRDDWFGFFKCKGCGEIGNGFAFKCTQCEDYYLDVRCASLPSSVWYGTHEHPLALRHGLLAKGGCPACSESLSGVSAGCDGCNFSPDAKCTLPELTFGCDSCSFGLHAKCVLLPRTISHRYDEHPFTLINSPPVSKEDEPNDEYYCEFCEFKMGTNWWFYRCDDCDRSVGSKCIRHEISLFSIVKLGSSYVSPYHSHPLVCIQATSKWGKACHRCHKKSYCGRFAFECASCKIFLDLKCAYTHPS